jgi:hypothetical protein
MSREVAAAKAAEDREFEMPKHFLEKVNEQEKRALESLLAGCRLPSAKILVAFRNVNETLRRRYEQARTNILPAAGSIAKRNTNPARVMANDKALFAHLNAQLGPYDASINELALWHGTTNPEAAGGIAENGFDSQYFGKACGSVYGAGFYFAECAETSHAYTRAPWSVNTKYNNCHVIFLCRVVAGKMKESPAVPSEEEKMTLTAECLGSGGRFGADSKFHSVLGNGWAYVAMHPHQTYPDYVIVYHTGK